MRVETCGPLKNNQFKVNHMAIECPVCSGNGCDACEGGGEVEKGSLIDEAYNEDEQDDNDDD